MPANANPSLSLSPRPLSPLWVGGGSCMFVSSCHVGVWKQKAAVGLFLQNHAPALLSLLAPPLLAGTTPRRASPCSFPLSPTKIKKTTHRLVCLYMPPARLLPFTAATPPPPPHTPPPPPPPLPAAAAAPAPAAAAAAPCSGRAPTGVAGPPPPPPVPTAARLLLRQGRGGGRGRGLGHVGAVAAPS